MPRAVIYFVVAMLLVGIMPLPYGYYMFLRLIAFGMFGFAAYIAHQRKYNLFPWSFGFMALLFNPIFTIHFPKEAWMVIDFVASLFVLITSKKISSGHITQSS